MNCKKVLWILAFYPYYIIKSIVLLIVDILEIIFNIPYPYGYPGYRLKDLDIGEFFIFQCRDAKLLHKTRFNYYILIKYEYVIRKYAIMKCENMKIEYRRNI
jgi:hypothetical protein